MNNEYEIQDNTALITIYKKDGTPLIAKIDSEDVDRVKSMGTWFAEWHKDFNSYLVQNLGPATLNGKTKTVKRSLHSVIMNASPKAPIRHINEDTLDNTKFNLELVERNSKNEYDLVGNDEVAIILKDKYGKPQEKALISKEDLFKVLNDNHSWVYYKNFGNPCVVSNTPEGRIYMDKLLMNVENNVTVHHINLNPLDNRRHNLEIVENEEV
ncbi:hypothetical protein [Clostridium sp.]|uniref:hypothetical protein n=1 Tax=Clostridium sp. TaxID=1506 RepID=UPI0032164DF7